AEAAFKRALELKPNDAPAKEALDKIADARKKDAENAALAEGSERRKAILAAIEKAIEAQRIENWDAMADALEPLQKESIPDAALKEKYQGLLKIAQTERKTRQEAKKLIEEGVQQLADKKHEDALKSFKEVIALWPDARLDQRVASGMAAAQAALAGVASKEPGRERPEGKTEVAMPPEPKNEPGKENPPGPPGDVSEQFKRNMADGDRFLRQRRYQEAINAYELVLKERPGDPRATDLLGQAKEALRTGDGSKINFPPGPEGPGGGGQGGNGPGGNGPGGERRPPRGGR
ncbi:MAG: hypothetical protein KIS92_23230, partial [Planctomycetota bacterium]|nr:hypothetical protein [Planctomycetota bacterium]